MGVFGLLIHCLLLTNLYPSLGFGCSRFCRLRFTRRWPLLAVGIAIESAISRLLELFEFQSQGLNLLLIYVIVHVLVHIHDICCICWSLLPLARKARDWDCGNSLTTCDFFGCHLPQNRL